ncbi:MAG: pyridoxamine 5'-phosphate oxidase family protein [Deltaproteobacteria bacterium]|jgi:nitroimidazol reductase NimA-like FMN-containing flavoprotein (pyridoxamine 5'-phosphate oxidase superfamily)|nr:pyridoxamine 5'-phosphate oxidase family protein [Deltaproteobacteria bacterium]
MPSQTKDHFTRTPRTTVRRRPARARYDRQTVHAILDEALFCHVGFVVDGQPFVIPTIHARLREVVYLHGSSASRMLRTLAEGVEVCLTATILDGLVLARSAFHHSMNYRSVMVFGRAREVVDLREQRRALQAVVEHVVPGRWADARHPSEAELRQTKLLALALSEASAKVRTGPPLDDESDYELPLWAGELPLRLTPLAARPDPRLPGGIAVPSYVTGYERPIGPGRPKPEV